MPKWFAAFLFLSVTGCNSNDTSSTFTTVDSNVAGMPDSMPTKLHLDSFRKDTSVRVTLDSAGPTVHPQDTAYANKPSKE